MRPIPAYVPYAGGEGEAWQTAVRLPMTRDLAQNGRYGPGIPFGPGTGPPNPRTMAVVSLEDLTSPIEPRIGSPGYCYQTPTRTNGWLVRTSITTHDAGPGLAPVPCTALQRLRGA